MLKKLATALLSLVFIACFAQSALALETTWFPSTIPVGLEARAFGMGGACLAVADARSYPANPAALVFLTDEGVFTGRFVNPEFDSSLSLGDQEYSYLCYVNPVEETDSAYSLTYYQDSFRNEWELWLGAYHDYHLYTSFLAIQYGYGHRFSDRISLGLNLRRVNTLDGYETTDIMSGVASVDAGAVFHPNKMMVLSVLITDVFAPDVEFLYEYDDDGDPSTPAKKVKMHYVTKTRVLFGGAFRIGDLLLLAMDVDYNVGQSSEWMDAIRIGGEVHLGPVALRGGLYHGDLTVGGGLKLGSRERDKFEINLDFAQTFPTSGATAASVQCMQLTVFF